MVVSWTATPEASQKQRIASRHALIADGSSPYGRRRPTRGPEREAVDSTERRKGHARRKKFVGSAKDSFNVVLPRSLFLVFRFCGSLSRCSSHAIVRARPPQAVFYSFEGSHVIPQTSRRQCLDKRPRRGRKTARAGKENKPIGGGVGDQRRRSTAHCEERKSVARQPAQPGRNPTLECCARRFLEHSCRTVFPLCSAAVSSFFLAVPEMPNPKFGVPLSAGKQNGTPCHATARRRTQTSDELVAGSSVCYPPARRQNQKSRIHVRLAFLCKQTRKTPLPNRNGLSSSSARSGVWEATTCQQGAVRFAGCSKVRSPWHRATTILAQSGEEDVTNRQT